MPRKKENRRRQPDAEIVSSPTMIRRTELDACTIQKLVQQQVAEALAQREAAAFEPFFRSRQVAYELRRLQCVPEQKKWSVYYERYGCQQCKRADLIHAGNGYCPRCYSRMSQILKGIIREFSERAK
jgi:protein-arginine kinase activator protein McsA